MTQVPTCWITCCDILASFMRGHSGALEMERCFRNLTGRRPACDAKERSLKSGSAFCSGLSVSDLMVTLVLLTYQYVRRVIEVSWNHSGGTRSYLQELMMLSRNHFYTWELDKLGTWTITFGVVESHHYDLVLIHAHTEQISIMSVFDLVMIVINFLG